MLKLPDQNNRLKLKLKLEKLKLKLSELQSKLLKQDTVLPNTTDRQHFIPCPRVFFLFFIVSQAYTLLTTRNYIIITLLRLMISFQWLNCSYPPFI